MALIFMDGFDKYGGVNSNATSVQTLLQQEWTTAGNQWQVTAPLSATGNAIITANQSMALAKTLAASYGRLIGGFRFNTAVNASAGTMGILLTDAGTSQCCVSVNASTGGTISVRNGSI